MSVHIAVPVARHRPITRFRNQYFRFSDSVISLSDKFSSDGDDDDDHRPSSVTSSEIQQGGSNFGLVFDSHFKMSFNEDGPIPGTATFRFVSTAQSIHG